LAAPVMQAFTTGTLRQAQEGDLMKVLVTIIVFLAVAAGAGAVFVWFGFFNISARVPHWDITLETIEVLRDRSIIVNSRDVKTPPLADPALVPKGAALYQETCRQCHGAPGISAHPFSQGLTPPRQTCFRDLYRTNGETRNCTGLWKMASS